MGGAACSQESWCRRRRAQATRSRLGSSRHMADSDVSSVANRGLNREKQAGNSIIFWFTLGNYEERGRGRKAGGSSASAGAGRPILHA